LPLPLSAYRPDGLFEIVWQRGFEIFPFAPARVTEAELPRMQHLSWKMFCQAWGVNFIAQNGMTQVMEMHADLMCASAVKPAFKETRLVIRTKNAVFRPGLAAARRTDAHSLPMNRMSPDFLFDYACLFSQFPCDQREINLFDGAFGELFR
jgi:hypothetical protein